MRTLLVTPFPPARDGLATYASQQYSKWRSEGLEVEVLSPEPSAGRFSADLKTILGMWRALRIGRRFDRVVVQFHPESYFYGMDLPHFLQGWAGLMMLFSFSADIEVVVHETPYGDSGRLEEVRTALWRLLWSRPRRVCVHSEAERLAMAAKYSLDPGRLDVIDHGETFERHSSATREEARSSLGIDEGSFLFLCAGFIQPHKGFDRAARALRDLKGDNLRLAIVGEMRVWTPEHQAYLDLLHSLADCDPRVTLHEGYVSDETFDRWIVACDAVVLPYRHIWSSGVAERAALYDRPVIATDVGGLAEQVRSSSRIVTDSEGLRAAMAELSDGTVQERDTETELVEALPPSKAGDLGAGPGAGATRVGLQSLVLQRAQVLHDWYEPLERLHRPILDVAVTDPLAAHLALPSGNRGLSLKALAQQVVRRLIDWRVVPIAIYVNALRDRLASDGLLSVATETHDGVGTNGQVEVVSVAKSDKVLSVEVELADQVETDGQAETPPEAVRRPSAPPRRRRPSSGSAPRS